MTGWGASGESHLFSIHGACFLYQPSSMRLFRLREGLYRFLETAEGADDTVRAQAKHFQAVLERSSSPEERTDECLFLTILLTHRCNMRCAYCFDRASEEGTACVREMDLSKVRDVLVNRCRGRREVCVTFFGGEPLLEFGRIRDVVALCETLRKAGVLGRVFYSVTSNGRLLTEEMAQFFNAHQFSFTLSADFCREEGGSTEDGGMEKYFPDDNPALRRLRRYVVRATVTPEDIRGIACQHRNFSSRGVRCVTFLPAVGPAISYTAGDAEEWNRQIERIVLTVYRNREPEGCRLGNIDRVMDRILQRRKKRDCLSDRNTICLDTDGGMYPCHRMTGLGPVYQVHRIDEWVSGRPVAADCVSCWAGALCTGLCAYERLCVDFDTQKFLCDIYSRQVELACWACAMNDEH